MKCFYLTVGVLALLGAQAWAASEEEESKWLLNYYKQPEPDRISAHIQTWHDQGLLAKDAASQPALAGFLAQALRDTPRIVNPCLKAAEKLPEVERDVVFNAIWLSGSPTGQDYFKSHGLKQFTDKKAPDLDGLKVNGPTELQFCWGRFSASGKPANVRPIVAALRYSDDDGAAERLKKIKQPSDEDKMKAVRDVTYQTAFYTLQANCRQDPNVFEICKGFLDQKTLTPKEEAFLRIVLNKVRPDEVPAPTPR